MAEHNARQTLAGLDRFPPTVTDHTEYKDGYDLELLDSGDTEDPRFIRVVEGQDAEFVGFDQ